MQSERNFSFYLVFVVNVQLSVGIDVYAHLADVGVDVSGRVALLEVVQEVIHVDLLQEDKVPETDLAEIHLDV